MARAGSTRWWTGAALALSLVGSGCDGGGARAPNPTKPVDEGRAVEVIRRAMRAAGLEPAAGRDEKIAGQSRMIHLDVGVQGKRFGVAYITTDEAQSLGTYLPAPNSKQDESLKLLPAGDDGNVHVLLLFQQNYLYDDLAGEAHEQTTIAAESAIARDVRDFVARARNKKFE